MTAPEVCFFKDFDSFTLEAEYLEIVYGGKPFRFGYATNHADRKFFLKSLGKIGITLQEMLLQYEDQAGFDTAYRVDLCAEFEDAFKFGSFVEKLTRLAGYHHVQPPDRDLSPNTTSDYENEDDMNESDIRENTLNQHQISESRSEKEMDRPLIKFTEECALRYTFAQSHFEVYHPETGTTWRFLHAAIRQRGYKLNPRGRAPRADRSRFFLFNVTLQARKTAVRARRAAQYVDVGPCDVEFDVRSTTSSLATLLNQFIAHRYTATL